MKSIILIWNLLLCVTLYGQARKEILYVGTFSIRESKGIYVFELNRANGSLKLIQTVPGPESPNFLEIHPEGKYLYSVNRAPVNPGESYGSVVSYAIDPKTGKLTMINQVSSFGKDPCHISLDKTGRWAFVSNYSEGNFVVLPVFEDGSLGGAPSDSKKYSGKSVNKFRQDQPHIHSAEVSPDNKFVYVADLGTDRIHTYSIDVIKGKILPVDETKVAPGAGPRHFTIHPSGNFGYLAEELTSTVAAFNIDKASGKLSILQDTIASLPPDSKEVNISADIHTDKTGRFLYMSNRGYDGITAYTIKPDGKLQHVGYQKTGGKTPRNFLVDAKGKFLWTAHQDTDNITVFRINQANGTLIPAKISISVPSPVCIRQLTLK